MAAAKPKSPTGLMSEGAKKMVTGVKDAARTVVGKPQRPGAKGPGGNLSEGAKKLGRGAARAVGAAFGTPSTKAKRPGGK
jgi:hypothetical protein